MLARARRRPEGQGRPILRAGSAGTARGPELEPGRPPPGFAVLGQGRWVAPVLILTLSLMAVCASHPRASVSPLWRGGWSTVVPPGVLGRFKELTATSCQLLGPPRPLRKHQPCRFRPRLLSARAPRHPPLLLVPPSSFLTCPVSAQHRAPSTLSGSLSCVARIICHRPTKPWAPGGRGSVLAGLSAEPGMQSASATAC